MLWTPALDIAIQAVSPVTCIMSGKVSVLSLDMNPSVDGGDGLLSKVCVKAAIY